MPPSDPLFVVWPFRPARLHRPPWRDRVHQARRLPPPLDQPTPMKETTMTTAPITANPTDETFPICGAQYDEEVCDRDAGHDGEHCANLSVGWENEQETSA